MEALAKEIKEEITAPAAEFVIDCENIPDATVFEGDFDYTKEYPNSCYEDYIAKFEPNTKKRLFYRFVKRAFDMIASALMLICLSPIFLIVAILIKCESRGPVIFKQKRMGKDGKVFNCYKFRSMKIDTPKDCATSLLENPEQYYTKVGKIIRKLSIDELPQLWCVFVGTMSFIGYRPLVLTEEKCNIMRDKLGVFAMRPGISGYAQVIGRDDVYYKNKAILDSIYVKRASLLFDIKLVFMTVSTVLSKKGNDANKEKNNE
ncbi:MAG: sugar transferase [Clostridia bacterium]|nr:sugar transferase [Clostridia bacterium]